MSKVFKMWNDKGEFPILFSPLTGYQDLTGSVISTLNLFTGEIKSLFSLISANLNRISIACKENSKNCSNKCAENSIG